MSDLAVATGQGGRLDRTRLTLSAGVLMRPVLARVVGIHAARADLPMDRFGDSLLIADAIAARACDLTTDGRVPVSLQSSPGRLELRIGPLARGASRDLLDAVATRGAGRLVERLADEVRVRTGTAGGETLVLRLGG